MYDTMYTSESKDSKEKKKDLDGVFSPMNTKERLTLRWGFCTRNAPFDFGDGPGQILDPGFSKGSTCDVAEIKGTFQPFMHQKYCPHWFKSEWRYRYLEFCTDGEIETLCYIPNSCALGKQLCDQGSSKMTQTDNQTKTKPKIFKCLWSKSKSSSASCCSLFSECVHVAVFRTCEYLRFTDPDKMFRPSGTTLREIFLMTYIQHSFQLNLSNTLSCTVMTQRQRFLLGTDWVWAVLDPPNKNPRIQIAVQVLHLTENPQENLEEHSSMEMEPFQGTRAERLMEFSAGIGMSCFALFLFFGYKNDPENICGLLSNNLHQALGKCVRIDQTFIEGFFKGAKTFVTPNGMLQAVVGKKDNDPLTMLVKFTK